MSPVLTRQTRRRLVRGAALGFLVVVSLVVLVALVIGIVWLVLPNGDVRR